MTCLAGEAAPLDPGRVRALAPDGPDLELATGGQRGWWWLLAAE